MEDVHITVICLLYDITIFTYSTVAMKWFAFNEQARGGYICLMSSANHTDVLRGVCDSTGHRQSLSSHLDGQRQCQLAFEDTVHEYMFGHGHRLM